MNSESREELASLIKQIEECRRPPRLLHRYPDNESTEPPNKIRLHDLQSTSSSWTSSLTPDINYIVHELERYIAVRVLQAIPSELFKYDPWTCPALEEFRPRLEAEGETFGPWHITLIKVLHDIGITFAQWQALLRVRYIIHSAQKEIWFVPYERDWVDVVEIYTETLDHGFTRFEGVALYSIAYRVIFLLLGKGTFIGPVLAYRLAKEYSSLCPDDEPQGIKNYKSSNLKRSYMKKARDNSNLIILAHSYCQL